MASQHSSTCFRGLTPTHGNQWNALRSIVTSCQRLPATVQHVAYFSQHADNLMRRLQLWRRLLRPSLTFMIPETPTSSTSYKLMLLAEWLQTSSVNAQWSTTSFLTISQPYKSFTSHTSSPTISQSTLQAAMPQFLQVRHPSFLPGLKCVGPLSTKLTATPHPTNWTLVAKLPMAIHRSHLASSQSIARTECDMDTRSCTDVSLLGTHLRYSQLTSQFYPTPSSMTMLVSYMLTA